VRIYGPVALGPQIAMRRHRALIPFSHHHHRALVVTRSARAAAGDAGALLAAARDFLVFFDGWGVTHFRDEEEHLFPLLFEQAGAEAPEELVRALLDHARLHALAAQLRSGVAVGVVEAETLQSAGALLEAHVRLEERELFPLIELRAATRLDQTLEAVPATRAPTDAGTVNL
jgi:hypothetical protein